jgi:hypothetical protein
MRKHVEVCSGLALSLILLGACSKPAPEAADASSSASNSATAASQAATDTAGGPAAPGGAVSPPPANGNEAVNTDTNKSDTSQSAASTSFTEDQARGHIKNAGYTDVTGLTKTPEGLWTGKAKKDGKTVDVSVDFKGAVSAK